MKKLRAYIVQNSGQPKVKHYSGIPPLNPDDKDQRNLLNDASELVIEKRHDGVFLFRFDESGAIVGDTWHKDEMEAKEQAEFEYGDYLTQWIEY